MQQGRMHDYHGIAVHPRHLSLWERWVLKLRRDYRPDAHLEAMHAETLQQVLACAVSQTCSRQTQK